MEDIIWFNKEKGKKSGAEDVTISKVKKGYALKIRNGWPKEISESGFIRIGFSRDGKKIFFMNATASNGWSMTGKKGQDTMTITFQSPKLTDGLARFEGAYNMEVSEDELCYIDRRNVL